MINRHFDWVRRTYARLLTGTLHYRPVVFVAVGHRRGRSSSPSTCSRRRSWRRRRTRASSSESSRRRRTRRSTRRSSSRRRSTTSTSRFPRARASSRSRPRAGGFGGMVTKPWSARKKSTEQLQVGVRGAALEDPGRARHLADPAGAAGRRRLPRGPRHRVDRRAGAAHGVREQARREGVPERPLHVRRRGPEVRPAAGRGRLRPRQAEGPGRQPEPGRPGPLDAARRRLREPLQHPGPQLQGHPADQARRAPDARPAPAGLRHRRGQQARAAVDLRDAEDHDRAAGAEAVPAAQRRAHPGRHPAGRLAGRRARASSRTRPAGSCRRASRSTTPANRASCAPRGASSSARSCSRGS